MDKSKSISMEEYLDKIYEGKEVVYTYRVVDEKGNKEAWNLWSSRIRTIFRNSSCEFDWSDSGWYYKD